MTPVGLPAAVLARAGTVTAAITAHTGVAVAADELLGGRAALLGLQHGSRVSAGGATRLLRARDEWCALTLSRPDDVDAVPALLGCDGAGENPWPAIQRWVADRGAAEFADRARLLGLPVGVLGETAAADPVVRRAGCRARPPAPTELLVADLSSMWAGPLCGQILARAGATVVKVETTGRPDGTRAGPEPFFDWINAQKLSYVADFSAPESLRALLAAADVVIESSRAGALDRRGLGPDVPGRDGRVWLRVTGHGADGGRAGWVAFGDDAAVSGGLVGGMPGDPEFCADAVADPLTGIHAALQVLQSQARGGGEVIAMSMAAVAAGYAELPRGEHKPCTVCPAHPVRAPGLGTDNDRVDDMVARRLSAAC